MSDELSQPTRRRTRRIVVHGLLALWVLATLLIHCLLTDKWFYGSALGYRWHRAVYVRCDAKSAYQ
jgi:hypothetical protein